MRQTLCYIPETLFGLPLFGWGLGLGLLLVAIVLTHVYQYVKHRKISDIGNSIALLAIGGAMLIFIFPCLAESGCGVPIRGYGCCLLLAILAALGLVVHLAKRQNIPAEKVVSLCFWTVVAGILGARLFYVTEYWNETLCFDPRGNLLLLESLGNILNFPNGGLTVFGSVFGGMLGAIIFIVRNKMPTLRTFDILATAVPLGMAIGRIGCLLNGCCFGCVTKSSLGIVFPPGSPAHFHQITHGLVPEASNVVLPVHPTQIYSSCLALLLCGTLLFLGKRRFYQQRDGLVLASFMILYSAGRFCIEILRTDEDSFLGTGLTISQNVSIVFGLVGIALFVFICKKAQARR
jgi:phosphatidylglycerol:prolipoprotein diacylglycerol transferase